jgi:hypothetical protein
MGRRRQHIRVFCRRQRLAGDLRLNCALHDMEHDGGAVALQHHLLTRAQHARRLSRRAAYRIRRESASGDAVGQVHPHRGRKASLVTTLEYRSQRYTLSQ